MANIARDINFKLLLLIKSYQVNSTENMTRKLKFSKIKHPGFDLEDLILVSYVSFKNEKHKKIKHFLITIG